MTPRPTHFLPTAFLFLTACSIPLLLPKKDSSEYFVLDNTPQMTPVAQSDLRPNLALSVHRIQIPGYLDRKEIVRRSGKNRLEISDAELWLEPLNQAATRVFSQSLASQLGVNRLALPPSNDTYRDALQIKINIIQFEGNFGEEMTLRARWNVSRLEDGKTLSSGENSLETSLQDSNCETYVNAMARALEQLATIVAGAIREI